MTDVRQATAFLGSKRIATGALPEVVREVKTVLDADEGAWILIFDDRTGERIDVDFRGSLEDIVEHLRLVAGSVARPESAPPARGPGRPKLGVVAREVTLLPRHWEWLNRQPGGASVALRRLVDEARTAHGGRDVVRQAREAAYRFMSAMAGDEVGFEEATRGLFAGDASRFEEHISSWPADVREHAMRLGAPSFPVSRTDDEAVHNPVTDAKMGNHQS
jgi:uncharacterized protein